MEKKCLHKSFVKHIFLHNCRIMKTCLFFFTPLVKESRCLAHKHVIPALEKEEQSFQTFLKVQMNNGHDVSSHWLNTRLCLCYSSEADYILDYSILY